MICGSGGSKSNLAKAAGAEPSGQMRDEKFKRCGTKHISKSKVSKHTIFRPLLEVEMSEKMSKKCTLLCGAKHISKSTCTKHTILRPFLDVQRARSTFGSQKCQKLEIRASFDL